ncbi:hypothetical protein [Paludisphaera rhizosphaerae]|nr:hypothetical protein [Paludisphaera rhizosphaerae]
MSRFRAFVLGPLAFVGVLTSHAALADSIITVDVPGSTSTTLNGINDTGVAVGSYDASFATHAFIRQPDGTISTFDVAGAVSTYGQGINNAGLVTGYYDIGGAYVGYLRATDGTITSFTVPLALSTQGFGINNLGQIVGTYSLSGSLDFHGFIRSADGSSFTTFDAPGAVWTYAQGINDSGVVSGFYFDGAAFHGYLRATDGSFTTYDVVASPFSAGTFGNGINDLGTTVGYVLDPVFDSSGPLFTATGFVRQSDGTYQLFPIPPSYLVYAMDINNSNQIVGQYVVDGVTHGFITQAVPEPGAYAMLATGVSLLSLASSVRRRLSCRS